MEYRQKHRFSSLLAITAFATSFTRKVRGNRGVRARMLLRLTARLAVTVPFAALLYGPSPALAQPSLGTAEDFAVLGGTAVTCTDSVVIGDVGVDLGGAVTQTNCTISGTVHVGDTVAQNAYDDFLAAYTLFGFVPCDVTLTSGSLAGASLTPGVYCFIAGETETGGTLTLLGSSTDTWIFKIGTGGTGAFTGTNFSVVMSNGETCNNNVVWWTAEAATLTDSVFIGSILAGTSITATRSSLDGQALAKAAVTLTNTEVSVCGTSRTPPHPPIKVTGGGQIPVPNPDSKGRATFGFNAQPNEDGTATGHFNYLNHVTGLHVNGPVTNVVVIAINPDGSPKTVLFSGTCDGSLPACSFSVTVEDHGEPGTSDQFGITVTGLTEVRSQRVISKGNIQFHN
jgi:hypothetical protein